MPRVANLLLVCTFFQLFFCAFFLDDESCNAPEWFQCSHGECISYSFKCDGWNDCGDNSDENNCWGHKPINPSSIVCAKDEYKCKNGECIPSIKFCDTILDCFDKSDEYDDCVKDLKCDNRFLCDDKHCILKEWYCDGKRDCPDGSDESNCTTMAIDASDCHNGNDRYLCKNQRCIPLNIVCDNTDNCGDGSDESPMQCKSNDCTSAQCSHDCRRTPKGPVCTCRQGYKLHDNHTCIDIDECQTYGICDQKCVNIVGSYKCNCEPGYTLLSDNHTCEGDGGEATMVFSTTNEIRTMYLKAKKYFVSVGNIRHADQVAIDGDYIYWSNDEEDDHSQMIMRINSYEKREVVVRIGLETVTGLVVDWITHNIYFTDETYGYIGVCDNDGTYCTILIDEKPNELKGIALIPANGIMYWSSWGNNPHIAMAGMDGKNIRAVISKNVGWPKSVTVDYPNNRLYWIDAKLHKIESARLDGTDRRIILQDIAKHPLSLAIFENRLYWSDWEHDTIQSCDKFSGKDWELLIQTPDLRYNLHIDHPAIKPKFQNPCLSKPCSELCLLNQNRNYTCACILGEKLRTDNYTCQETEKKQHFIIVAGNTFINYYHKLLGNPKTTVNRTTKQITAITCDSLSGTILASDQSTNHIIRYDPITGDMKNLFIPIVAKTLGGMAFDHIGNNLYLSNIEDKTIEVYNLATMERTAKVAKTVFYFDERPYDIALIPEEGEMFVVFKYGHKEIYHIDKMKMNGIIQNSSKKMIRDNLMGPKISLHYNRGTKALFYSDQSYNHFFIYTPQGLTYSTGMENVASLAGAGDLLFWTLYDSNILYYTDTRSISNPSLIAFHMPETVKNPLVIPLYKIAIHEEYGCQSNNGNCSHVCLTSSATSFICACPPKMMLSANNRTCVSQTACPDDKIKCSEHDICIKKEQWCDGNKDCPNGEDEVDSCKEIDEKCGKGQFMCKTGKCISLDYRCNSYFDCPDASDEENCFHSCQNDEYECRDRTCISNSLVCDSKFDCPDFSDEFLFNCFNRTCHPDKFKCAQGTCIPKEWVCDGEPDCADGEDETENCESRNLCGDDHFKCDNYRCISSSLKCNSIDDCGDNSDEKICIYRADYHSGNCNNNEYHCFNTDICLPKSVRCNGVQDCPKNDDERHCAFCFEDEFTCNNQKCIPQSWVCDKINDCGDNSDEKDCGGNNLRNINSVPSVAECKEFKCSTGACLPFNRVCDGINDCTDNSDEGGKCAISCVVDNPCKGLCYKTPQGPICGCRNGYRLAIDNISCNDINECEHDGVCSQICRNTVGSFKCSCFDGYFIRRDRVSCKAGGPPMKIITATDDDIRYITPDLDSLEVIYPLSGLSVTSLDVNAINDSVYWTSGKTGSINKLNITTKELSIIKDVGNPDALAVDWVTNNIYFSNSGQPNVIKICNFELQKCAAMVKIEDAAKVSVLVLHPRNRWLFWSQITWKMSRKPSSKIFRTDMMGVAMKTIVSQNIDLVNGMAIDYMKSRLYWSDSFRKTIESCNLDGTQRSTFLNADRQQPLGINIYENSLYWLMGSSGILQKCNLYGNKSCTNIDIGASNVHEHFAILQRSRHPRIGNPCEDLNCDYMCVLSASNNATCICQDGKPITDNSTCTEDMNIQVAFATKTSDTSRNIRKSGGIYSIIIFVLLIATLLLCAYYYYRRNKLNALSDQSFNSIRFYNPSYDRRDEIAVTLGSIIPQSDVTPGQHEYINPMNDPINNKLLKVIEKNNTKMLEKDSEQERKWKQEIAESEKQDAYLIPEIRQK